jgi:hypothetical protein
MSSFNDDKFKKARDKASNEARKILRCRCTKIRIDCEKFLEMVGDRAWKLHTINGNNSLSRKIVSYIDITDDEGDDLKNLILLRDGNIVTRKYLQ